MGISRTGKLVKIIGYRIRIPYVHIVVSASAEMHRMVEPVCKPGVSDMPYKFVGIQIHLVKSPAR